MSLIHPYLKHIVLLVVSVIGLIGAIVVFRKCFNDEKFRIWILASLSKDNNVSSGSSGKALTGLLFAAIIALASIVSFIWTPTHLMPDYMFISLLSFIASLYTIKMVSGKFGNSSIGNDNGVDNNNNVADAQKKDDAPTTQ